MPFDLAKSRNPQWDGMGCNGKKEIIYIPLATLCSPNLGWYSYRKEFAPQREQILSFESVIRKSQKELKAIIPELPQFHSILFHSIF